MPGAWWLRLCLPNPLIFNSLEVDGSQTLFRGGSNTPDAPPGKRRIPQEKAVRRRNSPSELRIYLKILQRRFQMFAMPPGGLKVIKVSKDCCERRYAAQPERGLSFRVALSLGIITQRVSNQRVSTQRVSNPKGLELPIWVSCPDRQKRFYSPGGQRFWSALPF